MALCASASQLDDVLEAINGVAAIVDSSVPPMLPTAGDCVVAPADAVEPDAEAEESGELVDELENKPVTGNPLKIDETDIATAVCKTQSPHDPYNSRALTNPHRRRPCTAHMAEMPTNEW